MTNDQYLAWIESWKRRGDDFTAAMITNLLQRAMRAEARIAELNGVSQPGDST